MGTISVNQMTTYLKISTSDENLKVQIKVLKNKLTDFGERHGDTRKSASCMVDRKVLYVALGTSIQRVSLPSSLE